MVIVKWYWSLTFVTLHLSFLRGYQNNFKLPGGKRQVLCGLLLTLRKKKDKFNISSTFMNFLVFYIPTRWWNISPRSMPIKIVKLWPKEHFLFQISGFLQSLFLVIDLEIDFLYNCIPLWTFHTMYNLWICSLITLIYVYTSCLQTVMYNWN